MLLKFVMPWSVGKIISLIDFPLKTPERSLSSVMNSLIFPVFRIWGRGREEEDLSRNTFSILNLTFQPFFTNP